jgi:hypothetical protein
VAAAGPRPVAQVLIDIYTHDNLSPMRAWQPVLNEKTLNRQNAYVPITEFSLTATARYEQILASWDAIDTGIPTLHIRATTPVAEYSGDSWRSTWPYEHTDADVPGDHFTMMEDYASATADAVDKFVQRLTHPSVPPEREGAGHHAGT